MILPRIRTERKANPQNSQRKLVDMFFCHSGIFHALPFAAAGTKTKGRDQRQPQSKSPVQPFLFHNTLAGFDMALAQYVADYMGLTLEVVPMDFDGVLSELQMKNVDLGMAGLSPDPARADGRACHIIRYFQHDLQIGIVLLVAFRHCRLDISSIQLSTQQLTDDNRYVKQKVPSGNGEDFQLVYKCFAKAGIY